MIKIYNNKIIYINHRNKRSRVKETDIFKFLGEHVELDEKVTFLRIMNLLLLNEDLTNIVYAHTLGNFPFILFYDDMLQPLPAEEMKEHYDRKKQYLEVYYYPDVFKYEKDELFEWCDVHDIHLVQIGEKENTPYGIMFSKLGAFKDHKIKIKYDFNVHPYDSTKKITRKGLITPILKAKLGGMKLFDFFWGILYEISWMGSPKNRDAKSDELKQREYEFEEDVKNGTAKLTTIDDIKKLFKKKKPKKKLAKKK